MTQVGKINQKVVNILALDTLIDTPIFLGVSNIKHMQESHPYDYAKYKYEILNILSCPDYVGVNPADQSLEYVKYFESSNEYVKIAVRISKFSTHYARSLFVINNDKANRFISKGYLKKY